MHMLEELYLLSRHFIQTGYREYHREFLTQISPANRLSVIRGQRGVGKTTTMIQFLHGLLKGDLFSCKHLYIQADHFSIGNMKLYEIAQSFVDLGGKAICFDEIHTYPDWSRELKSIYDTFPELTVMATGSSALQIYQGSHDLSRRATMYSLQGFSFREFIELKLDVVIPISKLDDLLQSHEKIARSTIIAVEKKGDKILRLFNEYLEHGYYPFFQEYADDHLFHLALERNIHTAIEKDLLALHPALTGTSIRKIKKLLSFIAFSFPLIPDLNQLKKICDIGDERTLKTYLSYLEDGGIITMLAAAGKKMNVLEKPEKIYINNANQIHALRPADCNIGTIRETFFVSMISPHHTITVPSRDDFLVDETWTFEIGGRNKGFAQIKGVGNSYRVLDDVEKGINATLPLWMFGLMY